MTRSTIAPEAPAALESRVGWSEQPLGDRGADRDVADVGAGSPFATPADERYRELAAAGRGGMGVVAMTHDRRLGRVVALKRVADDVDAPAERARLMREASITARLEHPGIVAVHDAGTDADGAPFYTMRLIRGRSLAAALAAARDPGARLAFVRPLLAATEAVAYAHARGIAHGDLKPGNLMVGDFGEVQVVDWGAARVLADAEADLAADPALAAARDGDHGGTPAYLSPERARAEPSGRRADVWALGAILFEILAGRRLIDEPGGAAALARLRGPARPLPTWPADVPAELAAIAARALAWAPAARYPDAAAMADDLRRYFDGRRVTAHAYSSLELARRLVRAWRWPLAVVLAATIAGAIALAASWRRIERHRSRALAAEQATAAALAEARATLGAALASRAVAAQADGAVAEAEVLAAHALTLGESADARGVLATTAAQRQPEAVSRRGLGGCQHVMPGDAAHALCLDDGAVALWQVAPVEARRWRQPEAVVAATVVEGRWVVAWTPRSELLILDVATGAVRHRVATPRPRTLTVEPTIVGRAALYHSNHSVVAVDLEAGVARGLGEPCGGQRIASVGVGGPTIAIVCWDGAVQLGGLDGGFRFAGRSDLRAPSRPATAVALSPDQRTIAIGATDGSVQVIARDGWRAAPPRARGPARIDQLRFVGDTLAVLGDDGGVALWSHPTGEPRGWLPVAVGRQLQAAGDDLITTGAGWVRWRLPRPTRRHEVVAPAGYGPLATSPTSGWRAAGRGDGVVDLWRDDLATPVRHLQVSDVVIKEVAFSADGARLAVATAGGPGLVDVDVATGEQSALPPSARGIGCCARAVVRADGTLVGFHYDGHRSRWRGGVAVVDDGARAVDVTRTAADELVTLGVDGAVALDRAPAPGPAFVVPGAINVASAPDGAWLAFGLRDRVEVRDRDGGRRWTAPTATAVLAVAISADGRWLATGGSDGTVAIWAAATGALAATVRGHRGRIEGLAFVGADTLWSVGWDGTAQRSDLTWIATDPAALVTTFERRWTITLAQALAARGPRSNAAGW